MAVWFGIKCLTSCRALEDDAFVKRMAFTTATAV